jgi:hypothetical protein
VLVVVPSARAVEAETLTTPKPAAGLPTVTVHVPFAAVVQADVPVVAPSWVVNVTSRPETGRPPSVTVTVTSVVFEPASTGREALPNASDGPLGDGEGLADADALGDGDGDTLGEALGATLGETLGLTDGDALGSTLGLTDGDALGSTLGLTDGDALGATLGSTLGVTDGDALGSTLGFTDGDALTDELGTAVALGAAGAAVGAVVALGAAVAIGAAFPYTGGADGKCVLPGVAVAFGFGAIDAELAGAIDVPGDALAAGDALVDADAFAAGGPLAAGDALVAGAALALGAALAVGSFFTGAVMTVGGGGVQSSGCTTVWPVVSSYSTMRTPDSRAHALRLSWSVGVSVTV